MKINNDKLILISNPNTIDFNQLKKENPLSYCFYYLSKHLDNSGMTLIDVNEDDNRVYFKIRNNINNKTTGIRDLSKDEIIHMDIFMVEGIKSIVWGLK